MALEWSVSRWQMGTQHHFQPHPKYKHTQDYRSYNSGNPYAPNLIGERVLLQAYDEAQF